MSSPPIAGPSSLPSTFDANEFIWNIVSEKLIDMHVPWVKGSKYQSDKVSEQGSLNLRLYCFCFCFSQYARLHMRYDLGPEGDAFIAYRDVKHVDSADDSTWRNARCAQDPCSNCTKRGNTCLRRVVDLYGDVDLGACVWYSLRGLGCSIKQRLRGARGPRSPKTSSSKG